jgi:hypothetical protein
MRIKTEDVLPIVIKQASIYAKERWPYPEESADDYIYEDDHSKLMEHPWIAATPYKRWNRV